MAVGTPSVERSPRRGDGSETRLPGGAGRERPGKGAEFWWWVFMRVSGIVLLVLAVGHVLIMHVFGEGVDRVNFAFVALRWQQPFWRTWDWLMLSLALIHGINGLRVIGLDYIRRPGVRIATNWFFFIAGLAIFALGTVVVFSFDPCRWPGTAGLTC
jgi:succinate dehydrogenase / fumarate reductase membrane anchor subunit